jgi:hypothetical protein
MSERGDAGTCNDAAPYSHQSITPASLQRRWLAARMWAAEDDRSHHANDDSHRFSGQGGGRPREPRILLFIGWFDNEMVVPAARF